MRDYVQITQIILGTAAAILVLITIAWSILALCSSILEKWFAKGQQAQWNTDMQRLRDWSHWFGDDEPTKNLIVNLSKGGDVSVVRDKWNHERQAQPKPGADEYYTYKSTQSTDCAKCGQHKHTPIRNDTMGGYVCLTCIDKELERLQSGNA